MDTLYAHGFDQDALTAEFSFQTVTFLPCPGSFKYFLKSTADLSSPFKQSQGDRALGVSLTLLLLAGYPRFPPRGLNVPFNTWCPDGEGPDTSSDYTRAVLGTLRSHPCSQRCC